MDLMGLSPEQINALANTGINSNALLLDAAKAVGAQDVARQRNEILGRTEEFNITLPDGQQRKLAIPLTEIDSVINAMARTARNPSEIALAEQLTLQAKARMQNYQAQTRETNEMLPFKMAESESRAFDTQASGVGKYIDNVVKLGTAPQTIEKSYFDVSKAQADAMIAGQEQNRNAELAAAANRIAGVPMEKWPEGPYAKDASLVNPGAMAALANKVQVGKKVLTEKEIADLRDYITKMGRLYETGKMLPTDMFNLNYANEAGKIPVVVFPDEKGKLKHMELPSVGGTQVTFSAIVKRANDDGVSPFDTLRQLYQELNSEGKK